MSVAALAKVQVVDITQLEGYQGDISSFEASLLLEGKKAGSYLIRYNSFLNRYACHVVLPTGDIKENPFSFHTEGNYWLNGGPCAWHSFEDLFDHLLDYQVGYPIN